MAAAAKPRKTTAKPNQDAGRPPSLTDKLIATIADAVRIGIPPKIAAARESIDADTFDDWMIKGERNGRGEWKYARLRKAILKAEAESEATIVEGITDRVDNWRALAWLAERRWPDRYVRHSVNGREVIKASPDETLPASDKVALIAEARESRRQRARTK